MKCLHRRQSDERATAPETFRSSSLCFKIYGRSWLFRLQLIETERRSSWLPSLRWRICEVYGFNENNHFHGERRETSRAINVNTINFAWLSLFWKSIKVNIDSVRPILLEDFSVEQLLRLIWRREKARYPPRLFAGLPVYLFLHFLLFFISSFQSFFQSAVRIRFIAYES